MRLILTFLFAVFTASGAFAQIVVTVPGVGGGHDREWYENNGYRWRDGQWYRGDQRQRERHENRESRRHDGFWKDGHYYRYNDRDRD